MRPEEIRALGKVAGKSLGEGVGIVRDAHLGLAGRTFRLLGPPARPVQMVHDGISKTVYATVRSAHRSVPRVGAAVVSVTSPSGGDTLGSSRRGNLAVATLNGLWGDRLASADSPLGVEMAVRHDHRDLAVDAASFASALGAVTSRVVVFVHGLFETEDSWIPSARKRVRDGAVVFGERLTGLGYTPVYLRYNTGRHISDNGRDLSRLLDELTRQWPVGIEELALVGHSMGGLVVRSACHQGGLSGAAWVDAVRHVVCLGTPHLGAPLERGINALSWALSRVPETRTVAGILNRRSAGIKDLRFGSLLEDDWRDVDPDEFLTDRCNEVPFLPGASYYFVAVTLTRDHRHPLGALVGDLLVQLPSASGGSLAPRRVGARRRHIPFELDKGHHIGGLSHFDLLSHPEVCAQLERWLGTDRSMV